MTVLIEETRKIFVDTQSTFRRGNYTTDWTVYILIYICTKMYYDIIRKTVRQDISNVKDTYINHYLQTRNKNDDQVETNNSNNMFHCCNV